jgi:benzylsuccinate CoA-transferase BbsE subunit
MESDERNGGLLDGVRILDLTDEKGSFCSKVLADLGASVIKVEKPGGDPSRKIGPFLRDNPSPENSLFFAFHNTNKLGITLDLDRKEGLEIFRRLLVKNDIVVESFTPGYMERRGIGYTLLSADIPQLILASVTGFGRQGPRSGYKSCDLVASASAGQMYLSGAPQTAPLKPFGEQSYYTASLFAAIGILLAVRKRALSGRGDWIDISLQESVASTLDHVMLRFFYEKVVARRQGSLSWNNGFCILPCKDGHMLVSLLQQWETLIEWMEGEGQAEDLTNGEWKDDEFRREHSDHVIEVMERWTRTHTRAELFELAQLMRFPWAPVDSPREVLKNPQLEARDFFVEKGYGIDGQPFQYPGCPYRFSQYHPAHVRRAPGIGEHNVRIYKNEIGLTDDELDRLSHSGVI